MCEGGNILRLWQAIVITVFLAGAVVCSAEKKEAPKNRVLKVDTAIQNQFAAREVLSRDSRAPIYRQETYYGKPGVFSLNEMLKTQNIKVYPEDDVNIFPDPGFGLGSKITIYCAPKVVVLDGNSKTLYRTKKATINEFFTEKNIQIGDQDVVSPKEGEIQDDLEIKITRVSETNITEKVSLPFQIINKNDSSLEKGKTNITQKGVTGEKSLIYLIRRENGIEISRELIKTKTTRQPKDEIILIGTKPTITVRCKYNDIVVAAAVKYNVDPNEICSLMMKESNGNSYSGAGSQYQGLFQYTNNFWKLASSKAGYGGISIFDSTAQIYTTAWAFSHGERNRWP